jgi:hypothetical protein
MSNTCSLCCTFEREADISYHYYMVRDSQHDVPVELQVELVFYGVMTLQAVRLAQPRSHRV